MAGEIVSEFLEILKNLGLNQKTYALAKAKLQELPPRCRTQNRLMKWLDRQMLKQCKLCIGQIPLIVSSDILESLLGKFKVLLARNPKAEFNRIVLALPCLCGLCDELNETKITAALRLKIHVELKLWERKNVQDTQWQLRRQFKQGKVSPDDVPKTGTDR